MTMRFAAKLRTRGALKSTVLSIVAATAIAGAAHAQSFRFTSFEVEGNQRIEDSTVLSYVGIAPGQSVSGGKINDGYQRLLSSGLFESVEIVPRGNRLIVIVKEYPTVNRISFEGNNRLKDEVLQSIVTTQTRRVYSPATAERDTAAIVAAYEQAGRLAATVTPKLIQRSDNRVDLVFEISEGRVTEIERVSFVGNRVYSDRRLRRVLESKQAGFFRALVRQDTFIADRIAFDEQLLRDFYLSRGYIDFRVQSTTPELSTSRDGYFLTLRVQEGQQFRFADVTATTDLPEIDPDMYADEIKIAGGDVYSPQAVDRTIERLELLATQQGLTFIRVTPRVTRNDEDLTLDVEFVIEKGPRIFVERIDIEGNATTLDRVIRREFDTVEGDPFNPREIRATAERIRALGYFSNAEVSAREGSSPSQIVVDVDVEEQPTGSLGFGVNYSVQNGVGVAFSFSETNFLGRGQQLFFSIDTGSDNQNSSINFTEPFFLNRDLELSLGLYHRTTDSQDATFDTFNAGFNVGLEFPVGEYSRFGLTYRYARDKLTPGTATTSAILTADAGTFSTSALGYRWNYSTIGTGLDPDRGVSLSFGQEFAGLGGDTKFVKTTFEAAAQRTIRNDEVTLRAVFEGGNITSLSNTNSLQANRFFNRQSILRGFESSGIGPRDFNAGNDPLGGNNYFAIRTEAQFPLGFIPDEYGMSGALFYDVGSVWGLDNVNGGPAGANPVDDGLHLRSAIGFGILWETQIGPLRFNFTNALDSQPGDKEQSFDLTISTRF